MNAPLNICSSGHDEVCYAGNKCPACEALDDLQAEIDTLKQEASEHQCEVPS